MKIVSWRALEVELVHLKRLRDYLLSRNQTNRACLFSSGVHDSFV